MKQDSWEQQLRDALDGLEQPVPGDLWAGIEQSVAPRPSARRVALRRWLGAAAAVVLLLGGAYIYNKVADAPAAPQPAAVVAQQLPQPVADVPRPAPAPVPVGPAAVPQPTPGRPQPAPPTPVAAEAADSPAEETADGPAGETAEGPAEETTPQDTPQPQDAAPAAAPSAVQSHPVHASGGSRHLGQPVPPRRHAVVSASLYAGNLTGSVVPGNKVLSHALAQNYATHPGYSGLPNELTSGWVNNMNGHTDEAEHRQPVVLGASVRVGLMRRLWVESGLLYTTMTSTFTHHQEHNTTVAEQRLTYVGVPLRVGYDVLQSRWLSLYGVAGVQADACVGVDVTTNGSAARQDRDRVQLSVSGHAGAELHVLPSLGVYVQPGVRYYPDNGSPVQNYFKEKPFSADLQFGVRYTVK